ncbi:MAG: sel1 repeat family protein, partial [Desulfuromonadales bacterium]|nr:sel1 repeat family protein [Desulfuromonadales bacterium]
LEENDEDEKAFLFYLQAAKNDNIGAQDKVAAIYTDGKLPIDDSAEILGWITQKADTGNDTAQCQLVKIYSSLNQRKDIPANPTIAITWLTKVLDKNTACGKRLVNTFLQAENTTGSERQLAIEWLTKRAENNDLEAQKKLGSMYFYGSDETKREGLKWLYKVASRGDVATQYQLAKEYWYGLNLKHSVVTGMAFYYVAASGEVVNDDPMNDIWISKAKEKIASSREDSPDKIRELEDAQKLAKKLIAKFKRKS